MTGYIPIWGIDYKSEMNAKSAPGLSIAWMLNDNVLMGPRTDERLENVGEHVVGTSNIN